MHYTINANGKLLDLEEPRVMGILNATPDSFYAASRMATEESMETRARQIVAEGADIIDVGACSTRPGSTPAAEQEETVRLRMALGAVRRVHPHAVVSVDTFRTNVARMAVEEYGAAIINDVSGGDLIPTAARLGVAYILMSSQPTIGEMLPEMARQVDALRSLGAKDIIIDPGFGFGKSLEQNYSILANIDKLQVFGLPVLAGISRKRMIYNATGTTPEGALIGSCAAHTMALIGGASILRVHDVAAARQVCQIFNHYKRYGNAVL